MRTLDIQPIVAAMGDREGDYMELTNSWASVVVSKDYSRFYVRGEPECSADSFRTLAEALAHAWHVLALYQSGRAD